MNIATTLRTEKSQPNVPIEKPQPDPLTEVIQFKLENPGRSSDFDLHAAVNHVLKDSECRPRTTAANSPSTVEIRSFPARFGLPRWPRSVWPPRQWQSRRYGETGPVRDRISRWMSARRSGDSPASMTENGRRSMAVRQP